MKRRHFIQFAGSTLATLGISQMRIQKEGLRYARVLAQDTSRKLALLVGINQYPEPIPPLKGCITDVELQRQLLIHRFGFNSDDILTITDAQATRQGILEAWEDHLIKQAKPGDVVVYHFSGHGSRVYDPDVDASDQLNSTFIPIDRTESPQGEGTAVSDITGGSLYLLMSALQTENFTAVLDSCYSGGGTRGNLTIRAYERLASSKKDYPSEIERDYQRQWLAKLNLTEEQFKEGRQKGIAKGVTIYSAQRDEPAADTPFDGFHAGAFTYAFTQYLWQLTRDRRVNIVMANVAPSTTRISGTRQLPDLEIKPNSKNGEESPYFLSLSQVPADAVLAEGSNQSPILWLGGIDAQYIGAFNEGVFAIVDQTGQQQGTIELASRNGLEADWKPLDASPQLIQTGAILQELARSIPNDLTLKIGLDPSLGNSSSQAQQALSQIPRMEPLSLGQGNCDCLLGVTTEATRKTLQQQNQTKIPPVGSIGLYSQGADLLPGSFGQERETVPDAIARLKPKLRSLLATKLMKWALNVESSSLNITCNLKIGEQAVVASVVPSRSVQKADPGSSSAAPPASLRIKDGIPELPVGTFVQFEIVNQESRDLYVTLLVIDAGGQIGAIYPNNWVATTDSTRVSAGQTRTIPDARLDGFTLKIGEPLGVGEVLFIASLSPLRNGLKALQNIATRRGQERGPLGLEEDGTEAVEVVESLLGDLDAGTRGSRNFNAVLTSARLVSGSQIAAMSITYEVVSS